LRPIPPLTAFHPGGAGTTFGDRPLSLVASRSGPVGVRPPAAGVRMAWFGPRCARRLAHAPRVVWAAEWVALVVVRGVVIVRTDPHPRSCGTCQFAMWGWHASHHAATV